MRKNKTQAALVYALVWAGFTAVTAMAMMAFPMGADPEAGLLRHVAYSLRYGNTGAVRALAVGAAALASGWAWARIGLKTEKIRISAVVLAAFFAWNTMIWISPRTPKALNGLLLLPDADLTENLLFYIQLTGNYYGFIRLLCRWLNGRQTVGNGSLPGAKAGAVYSAVILLCWLPILILRAPGALYTDTAIQILMYQGKYYFHASMPVLLTVLYGVLFQAGHWLAGDNGGLLVCMLFQTVLLLSAMVVACREVHKLRGNRAGLLLALFFGLMPVYPEMAGGLIKDSIHGAVYLFFLIFFARAVRGEQKSLWQLLLLGALAGATRKGGIYLAAGSLALLAIFQKDIRRKLLLVAGVLAAGSLAMNSVVYPALGIGKPWQRENYSLFYPITAYYCQEHQEELTPEEVQTISDVLDYETVCGGFSTIMTDDVKNTFHAENQAQVRKFLELNGSFFRKHPITCLEAIVYSKNLYYTPFSLGGQTMYASDIQLEDITETESTHFSYWLPEQQRLAGEEILEQVQEFLPVRILCSPGLYCWLGGILFLAAVYAPENRQKWILLPIVLLILGLLLSHINGAVRYAFPVMLCVPFLLAGYSNETKQNN